MKWWQQDEQTAVIKFYGDIYRWWNGADDFTNTFDELQRRFKTVIIKVHCYGGSVEEGNVIQHAIATATAKITVIIDIEGVAYSMGSLFILPATKIRMAENGFQMIHEPVCEIRGTERDFYNYGALLKKMKKNAANSYAARSKKPATDFLKLFDGSDHYFDAQECLAMGLIDEIVPSVAKDVNDLTKNVLKTDGIETIYQRFAAHLDTDTIIPNKNSTMKKDLIQKFGLTGVTDQSSDTAVIDALATKMNGLETTVSNLSKSNITALILTAETTSGKKFTDDQKKQLQTIGEKAGIEALQAALVFVQPAVVVPGEEKKEVVPAPITNLVTGEKKTTGEQSPAAERKDWKFSDWSEKDEKGLIEMRSKNPDQYKALYKAQYGKDPEIK